MKTTLEVVCSAYGWQGGTIHQAKDRFAVSSLVEMDRVCNRLIGVDVSDPAMKLYFFRKRVEALRMHAIADGVL